MKLQLPQIMTDADGDDRSHDFAGNCCQQGLQNFLTGSYTLRTSGKAERFMTC